jgi:hypothetical protein
MPANGVGPDGVVDPILVAPVLEGLLAQLGVYDRSLLRVGVAIGPKNSGVGSGPTMPTWLEGQANSLREPLRCSGGLGLAFAPGRAVDAVVKVASDAGVELARIDFAPVAAARAVGEQIDDTICVGSGQGWQARMRDFEVLEAMENGAVGFDAPLYIADAGGQTRLIDRYGWVELSPGLAEQGGIDVCRLAVAAGAAIGVAFESPADLLSGSTIDCASNGAGVDRSLQHLAGVELGDDNEATLQLQPRPAVEAGGAAEAPEGRAQRTPRQAPTTSLSPLRRKAGGDGSGPGVPGRAQASASTQAAAAVVEPEVPVNGRARNGRVPKPTRGAGRQSAAAAAVDRQVAERQAAEWEDRLHEADPITMFSPDTAVEEMMGKRNRPLSVDILIALVVIGLIAAGVYFFYL